MEMKNKRQLFFGLAVFLLAGCAEKLQTYLESPAEFIKDPHYAEYQTKADALEHSYLQKEIDYAQYLEKKQALDDMYTKEVEDRRTLIETGERGQ